MTKWQYLTLTTTSTIGGDMMVERVSAYASGILRKSQHVEFLLNELGADGWEVCGTMIEPKQDAGSGTRGTIILKRSY
ncbi:MAG: hypothetical protein J2P36_36305 [Ktedonobacteraceae bacterium]|nr:hypothetical protein [Ktedonobacteraceae bacterium]